MCISVFIVLTLACVSLCSLHSHCSLNQSSHSHIGAAPPDQGSTGNGQSTYVSVCLGEYDSLRWLETF